MSDRSGNLLNGKSRLKKHIREAVRALRKDGRSVLGVYHLTNGHFSLAIARADGGEGRVEVPGTPRASSGWMKKARAQAACL